MPDTNSNLGRVIRRLRTERGISQEGLAAISGIDRTFMGEIERGEANPSFDVLQRISRGLAIRLSELIRQYETESE
ncbi:helix-turn-helix transcriptional regulator [Nitrospirales bacterium NOB]|nr:helix-turn-helix transcriptional regulator [Nitrospirales bacterium NOB]